MPHSALIAYHPDFLQYDFGPDHPLRPERVVAGLSLLEELGLWDRARETLEPSPATDDDLLLVHEDFYLRAVDMAGSSWFPGGELLRFGLSPAGDTRPFPNMHHISALLTGGATELVRRILRGEIDHGFHPAGGLHHAMPGRASGFCVFNDPAVAAAVAVKEFGARVLYVDFDCHHGDGVQEIFYESPDVMTISFHESGRYLFPGTGFVEEIGRGPGRGFSLNVPMEPFTPDESWLQSVQAVLPPAVERFAPDLIISAHGADTHQWDPLTHISLTTRSFVEQVAITHGLAHEFAGGRWLAVGSGGYDWRRVVPRSWAIVWAEMTGRRALERLPAEWIGRWSPDAERPFPETLYDPGTSGRAAGDVAVSRANEATVKALQAAIGDRLRI